VRWGGGGIGGDSSDGNDVATRMAEWRERERERDKR
jgi:hypothetical protein